MRSVLTSLVCFIAVAGKAQKNFFAPPGERLSLNRSPISLNYKQSRALTKLLRATPSWRVILVSETRSGIVFEMVPNDRYALSQSRIRIVTLDGAIEIYLPSYNPNGKAHMR